MIRIDLIKRINNYSSYIVGIGSLQTFLLFIIATCSTCSTVSTVSTGSTGSRLIHTRLDARDASDVIDPAVKLMLLAHFILDELEPRHLQSDDQLHGKVGRRHRRQRLTRTVETAAAQTAERVHFARARIASPRSTASLPLAHSQQTHCQCLSFQMIISIISISNNQFIHSLYEFLKFLLCYL